MIPQGLLFDLIWDHATSLRSLSHALKADVPTKKVEQIQPLLHRQDAQTPANQGFDDLATQPKKGLRKCAILGFQKIRHTELASGDRHAKPQRDGASLNPLRSEV